MGAIRPEPGNAPHQFLQLHPYADTRTSRYEPGKQATPAGSAIEAALPAFIDKHPHFPQISFEEFMQLCAAAADIYNRDTGTDFGLFTHGFVRYFYREPLDLLPRLSKTYVSSGRHLDGRADVRFVRTEALNADLRAALASFGYEDGDLAFIAELGRILPMGMGRREDQSWQAYYTPKLVQQVRSRDAPLFAMFPEYDAALP